MIDKSRVVNAADVTKTTRVLSRSVLLLILLFPMACSTTTTASSSELTIVSEVGLVNELGETSGLYCEGDSVVTINDSGNSPVLFWLDLEGQITKTKRLAQQNTDWESVTGDESFYYVGDFGNNAGKRTDLTILKINKADFNDVLSIHIDYAQYKTNQNQRYGHDYDAEAFVALADKLVLFSKSWLTQTMKVYHVNKTDKQQKLEPVAQVTGLPGIVTGVDWDAKHNRYVVVGYNSSGFGIVDPFIALLTPDYQLIDSYLLDGYGQVEGICVAGDTLWLTQENSPFSIAKLIKVQLKK